MKYLVVIEPAADGSYRVYVPDLPGCVSCGDTSEEARDMIQEEIRGHLQLIRESGEPIPEPHTRAEMVEAA